jgi:hypothetical protein
MPTNEGGRHAPVPQGRARRFLHLGRAVGEMAASAADVPVDPLTRPGVPQAQRDHIAAALSRLSNHEFFRMRLVQTDPNFANFMLCTQLELNEVLGAELGTPPGPARLGKVPQLGAWAAASPAVVRSGSS